MALFIFHGASRDEQVGVKAKPSPAVAKMTALLKRAMRKRRRVKPAALEPVENLKPAATMAPAAQPLADAAPVSAVGPAGGTFSSIDDMPTDDDYFGRPGSLSGDGQDTMDDLVAATTAADDEGDEVFVVDEAPSRMP